MTQRFWEYAKNNHKLSIKMNSRKKTGHGKVSRQCSLPNYEIAGLPQAACTESCQVYIAGGSRAMQRPPRMYDEYYKHALASDWVLIRERGKIALNKTEHVILKLCSLCTQVKYYEMKEIPKSRQSDSSQSINNYWDIKIQKFVWTATHF